MVVHAEGFKTAPMTSLRDLPPTKEHFVGSEDTQSYDESIVSASIARYIVGTSKKCMITSTGFDASNNGPFRCRARSIF